MTHMNSQYTIFKGIYNLIQHCNTTGHYTWAHIHAFTKHIQKCFNKVDQQNTHTTECSFGKCCIVTQITTGSEHGKESHS